MKKGIKVLLIVVFVLLAGFYGVMLWQRDNITLLLSAGKHTTEELEQQMQDNKEKVNQLLDSHPELNVRDLTEEEKKALEDGSLTQEEVIGLLLGRDKPGGGEAGKSAESAKNNNGGASGSENGGGESSDAGVGSSDSTDSDSGSVNETGSGSGDGGASSGSGSGNGSANPSGSGTGSGSGSGSGGTGGTSAGGGQSVESSYEDALAELIARAYVLRANFESQLSSYEAAARAQYHALPPEQQTPAAMLNAAMSFSGSLQALEAQCDAEMEQLLAEMETLIRSNNGDLSIVDTVRQSYESEKALKKSWYLSQLESRTG